MTKYSYKIYPLSHLYCYQVYKFLENSNKAIVPQMLVNDITNKYDDELTFPLYYQFKETNITFTYYESVIVPPCTGGRLGTTDCLCGGNDSL